jgi:hypothetical protein
VLLFGDNVPQSLLDPYSTTTPPRKLFALIIGMSFYSASFSFATYIGRPINEAGERVTPSDLHEYRASHEFQGPCCLCASELSQGLNAETAYTEASIFVPAEGKFAGEYVAACAQGDCRYWGKLSATCS